MHHYFTDTFQGSEFGATERVRFAGVDGVGGLGSLVPSGPAPAPAEGTLDAAAAEAPKEAPAPPKTDDKTPMAVADAVGGAEAIGDKPAEKVTPENKAAVEEVVADGKVDAAEKPAVEDVTKRDVLAEVKSDAEKEIAKGSGTGTVAKLEEQNVDGANEQLQRAKDKGLRPEQLAEYEEAVTVATEREASVSEVVKAQQKAIGANQAEIDMINANKAQAAQDLDANKAEGEEVAQRFNENGGHTRDGGGVGDGGMGMGEAWDQGDDMSYDEMYQQWADNQDTWNEDFVAAQSRGDGDKIDETARSNDAEQLLELFEQRKAGETEDATAQQAIDQRVELIDELRESQQAHIDVLSAGTKEQLRAEGIDPGAEAAPAEPATEEVAPGDAETAPAETAPAETAPADAPVDLSLPEHRDQLLEQGVASGVIPENVTFNEQGQALYTVQQGDSLWSITERLNNNTFDASIWNQTMQSNAQLLDRTGSPDIINVGDQIVVPYFTQQHYAQQLQPQG